MSLTFLHPLFLLGLAAGVLPILIHRLTKRKAVARKFSAVRLLLQSRRVMSRPQRLQHLFLLALRILAVVTLVLILSRPVLQRSGFLSLAEGGVLAVILDNSLSMAYREDRGQRVDLARKAAKEMIAGFKGSVIVIPTAFVPGKTEADPPWTDSTEAVRKLEATPLSFGQGDPARAVGLALRRLKEWTLPKEILIISDLARRDWERFNLAGLGTFPADTQLSFIRIGGPNRDANFAVKEVRLAEGNGVAGTPGRVEAVVANLSDRPGSTLVQLYLSGAKSEQKNVEMQAGEEATVSFELFLERPGWINGEVRLSGDRLPPDDLFYFPLKAREQARVLIVDGDPQTSLRASESYYLRNALNPGHAQEVSFLPRVVTEQESAAVDARPYEALFLLNVARPLPSQLAAFLDAGKPVFIFLGDRVVPEDYHSLLFFPWRILGVRSGTDSGFVRIGSFDRGRESLKQLTPQGERSLREASFSRHFRIEGAGKPLLALTDGDPLLGEAAVGKGRLFLFTSSADLDWNDLAMQAAYLPLVQGLLKEAVGLGRDALPAGDRVGRPREGRPPSTQVAGVPGGPGIYESQGTGTMRRGLNPPFAESDLAKVAAGEMQKRFGGLETRIVEYQEGGFSGSKAGKAELWPWLLGLLLLTLAAEMGVANRL